MTAAPARFAPPTAGQASHVAVFSMPGGFKSKRKAAAQDREWSKRAAAASAAEDEPVLELNETALERHAAS
jgi:hypothetical protein